MKLLEGFKKQKVAVTPAEGFKKGEKIHALPIPIKKESYTDNNQSMAPPLERMMGEKISLLPFQIMKDIEEDLKEIEKVETYNVTTLEEKPSCSEMEEFHIVAKEFFLLFTKV